MQPRVMTIYGTRPEAVKVAPVIRAIETSATLASTVVVTGQHREMLDQVNEVFGITPDQDLDVFAAGQGLNQIMAKVFARLDPVLEQIQPDAVLVQGDTTTVAAASIAAFNREIPVVHLEAGLRSGNLDSPFPEEANRRLTSQVARLHLAPTRGAGDNLLRENIDPAAVAVTGNTVIDALLHTVEQQVTITNTTLARHLAQQTPMVLVTTHRRENWGDAMAGVGQALRELAQAHPDHVFVLPAHRNPVVREAILPALVGIANVLVTEPLPYGEFTRLLAASRVTLTDSGGVQEEAPSLGVPVLVMRENTERPEAVDAGTVRLIGTSRPRIVEEVSRLLTDSDAHQDMARRVNPYGDGRAATRCVAAIEELLGVGTRIPDFGL
ncbi:MAG: non-hydrolyzing UDP-N-acetylglucosamine 2-epimerase [Beutenbergiaceae bacterium]